ncbi:phage-related exported protein [Bordetella bronchiseptica RB50]|uniref:Phage-related exported protein n=1 Tax=Bordetella bronchiseptica (strain ATCC BAA-588 / NCTC 13252 / RB50) TaxID=257310 RepID=A0A0H3M0Z9_BORBR|nr:phage-related exported protein [Bordetella bronchiseptica RB50]
MCKPHLIAAFFAISSLSFAAQASDSLAVKLASIDEGRQMDPGSLSVQRANAALAEATKACGGMDARKIVDQVALVSNSLQDRGIYSRPVDILEGLKAIVYDGTDERTCSKVLSMYASVRLTMNHSSAVVGIRTLYNTATASQ